MNKKKTIPVLLVVLLVLIGCYFMIEDMQEKKAAEEADSTTYVTKIDDLVSMKYGTSDTNTIASCTIVTFIGHSPLYLYL